jgi:hypothetical protein
VLRIRLIKKLALMMNGVDVSRLAVGDILEIDDEYADSLITSGWAERVQPGGIVRRFPRNPSPVLPH